MKPVTIFLVEDDPGHSRLILKNLQRAGLENPTRLFQDGKSALQALLACDFEKEPVLVLLDLNLPVLDGYQVLERLKKDPNTQKVPVIVLTTTDAAYEIDRCYELGCNAYISKPIEYNKFVEVIHKLGLFLSVVKVPEDSARRGSSGFPGGC